MCFLINSKHPEEKIAKKDIVCYKRLKKYEHQNVFFSPYVGKRYNLNKLYRSKLKPTSCFRIDIGLHSYSCKKEATYWLCGCEVLVKGIIPKGSRYYYNPVHHEYVSNQIILQEIIKK